jgi:uncharacterized phage-associated protein
MQATLTSTSEFDQEAALASVLYLAQRLPDSSLQRLSKLLYLADKLHLERYGRFIFGDSYLAMKHGPVPMMLFDFLKAVKLGGPLFDKNVLETFKGSLSIDNNQLIPLCEANLDALSPSDRECLDEVMASYGDKSLAELTALSCDAAYQASNEHDLIGVEQLASTLPNAKVLLEYLRNPHP